MTVPFPQLWHFRFMAYTITLLAPFWNMFLLTIIILIVSISVHEFAHALAADRLGDPTPRYSGRLTLNPLAHLDPLGSLMFILARFGWGKPVPIDPFNFRFPRRDETLVALAGPLSNFLLFLLAGFLSRLLPTLSVFWLYFALININLGLFNLLPLPSLDGSRILLNLLPAESSYSWAQSLNQYGFYLIVLLFLLPIGSGNLISTIISPPA
jgi:Zn-dependent protease